MLIQVEALTSKCDISRLFESCCRIPNYAKENLRRVLVRQSIGLYFSDFLRLFTIHIISELSTFSRTRSFLSQDSDSIYLLHT